jgi:prepilin-type N-terminal cleavage/methylation domain-containing protein
MSIDGFPKTPENFSGAKIWGVPDSCRGFSVLEILLVIGIIAILALVFYPSFQHAMQTRALESAGKDILMSLQQAKMQAVKTKLTHRVRFAQEDNLWVYYVEREENPGQWNAIHGFIRKTISPDFTTTVNFPSLTVDYSPLGIISNYDANLNDITIHSPALANHNIPSNVIVEVFLGGSSKYSRIQSE